MKNTGRAARRLKKLCAALEEAGLEAALAAAERAHGTAEDLVPVQTGRLRASLCAETTAGGARLSAKCDYAAAVELGSSKVPPRPFLSPAAQAQKTLFPEEAARRAKARMESEGGRA